jgi:hypothetical protein
LSILETDRSGIKPFVKTRCQISPCLFVNQVTMQWKLIMSGSNYFVYIFPALESLFSFVLFKKVHGNFVIGFVVRV